MAFQDQPCHGRGGSLVQARQDVAVGVHRDGDGRVPEPFADDLGRDAGGERRGCIAVAQVVQTDGGQPGGADMLSEPVGEPLGWIGEPSGRVKTSPESS